MLTGRVSCMLTWEIYTEKRILWSSQDVYTPCLLQDRISWKESGIRTWQLLWANLSGFKSKTWAPHHAASCQYTYPSVSLKREWRCMWTSKELDFLLPVWLEEFASFMQDPAKKPLKKFMSTYFLSVHVAVTANFNTLLVLYICVI